MPDETAVWTVLSESEYRPSFFANGLENGIDERDRRRDKESERRHREDCVRKGSGTGNRNEKLVPGNFIDAKGRATERKGRYTSGEKIVQTAIVAKRSPARIFSSTSSMWLPYLTTLRTFGHVFIDGIVSMYDGDRIAPKISDKKNTFRLLSNFENDLDWHGFIYFPARF